MARTTKDFAEYIRWQMDRDPQLKAAIEEEQRQCEREMAAWDAASDEDFAVFVNEI